MEAKGDAAADTGGGRGWQFRTSNRRRDEISQFRRARKVFGGWQVAGIFLYTGGHPLGVT